MSNVSDARYELMLSHVTTEAPVRIVMDLLATARAVERAGAELLAAYGLSEARLAALLAVGAEPGITPAQLADRLAVTRATVTGLMDGLERMSLIRRVAGAADRRSLSVRVTPTGQSLADELLPLYTGWLGRVAASVAPEDAAVIARAMASMRCHLGGDTDRTVQPGSVP